jgi:hypothetical protein
VTPKVFGIGLSKTGTVSLTAALKRLGYNATHYPPPAEVMAYAARFDALTDISVIPWIAPLALEYPSARFILTTRALEPWLASCARHFAAPATDYRRDMRCYVFGTDAYDEATFRQAYVRHEAWVRGYFAGQRERLLVMDICGGEGYERLCPFLGVPRLDEPFPHENKTRG